MPLPIPPHQRLPSREVRDAPYEESKDASNGHNAATAAAAAIEAPVAEPQFSGMLPDQQQQRQHGSHNAQKGEVQEAAGGKSPVQSLPQGSVNSLTSGQLLSAPNSPVPQTSLSPSRLSPPSVESNNNKLSDEGSVRESVVSNREKSFRAYLQRYADAACASNEGGSLPEMEVRFRHLSVSTVEVEKQDNGAEKIPNVASTLLGMFTGCCHAKKQKELKLVNNATGIIKPGRLTLLLGPPGSGKTLFMKTLAGRVQPGEGLKVSGDVTYNGEPYRSPKSFLPHRVIGYVDQHDAHIAAMTVGETVKMASHCMNGGLVDKLKGLSSSEVSKAEMLLEVLGLQACEHVMIGDDLHRGISGGQRKRVTLAEVLAGNFLVLLLDEITTGLDAAAALDVVKVLRDITDALQLSVVAALLQPGPEVYGQFDDIILLNSGNIVYHGEREKVLPYFESLGFSCPARKDVADYLQEVTTKNGSPFLLPADELQRLGISPPKTAEEFACRWEETPIAQAMRSELESAPAPRPVLTEFRNKYAQPVRSTAKECFKMFRICTYREYKGILTQFMGNLIVGIVVSLVFRDLQLDDVQSKLGLLYLTTTNFGFMQASSMAEAFKLRSILYKHRSANFYPSFAFGMAQAATSLPITIANAVAFTPLLYWTTGLSQDDNGMHYVYYISICILLDMSMGQFFQLLSACIATYDAAVSLASVAGLLMLIFCGFVIAPSEIAVHWLWLYYINPFTYALTGLVHNELKSKSYSLQPVMTMGMMDAPQVSLGEIYLERFGFFVGDHWRLTSILYLLGLYFFLLALTCFCHHHFQHGMGSHTAGGSGSLQASGEADEDIRHGTVSFAADYSALQFPPCSLAWKNLSYFVDAPAKRGTQEKKLQLLHEVSGYCLPGTMTALMGASGAGKTTLLDVLDGRKTFGQVTGDIFVNGHPLDRANFTRFAGYVEQNDIHTPTATVKESLCFSAKLRLPRSVPDSQIEIFVSHTLATLELAQVAGSLVGDLSDEATKRVTIGVELVANPSIIFMDEPTSKLDSHAAMTIVKVIRRLAAMGRTIVCTIHQPSCSLFESFDRLLVLGQGGRTVFAGELGSESENLINYLQAIPGVPPLGAGTNPAVWMLDAFGAGTLLDKAVTDFAAHYESSPLYKENAAQLHSKGLMQRSPTALKTDFTDTFAASMSTQMRECLLRCCRSYWRSPGYNAARLVVAAVVAILFSNVYWQQEVHDYASANSIVAILYVSAFFWGAVCVLNVMPITGSQRAVFYRERISHMYHARVFVLAAALVEIPYLLASCLIFINVFYWCVGLRAELAQYLNYFLFLQLYMLQSVFFGQFLVYVSSTQQVAENIQSSVSQILALFAGYLKAPQHIPAGFMVFHWLNPLAFTFKSLVVTQFHEDDREVGLAETSGSMGSMMMIVSMRETMEDFIFDTRFTSLAYDDRFFNAAALVGFIIFWNVASLAALHFVKHIRR